MRHSSEKTTSTYYSITDTAIAEKAAQSKPLSDVFGLQTHGGTETAS